MLSNELLLVLVGITSVLLIAPAAQRRAQGGCLPAQELRALALCAGLILVTTLGIVVTIHLTQGWSPFGPAAILALGGATLPLLAYGLHLDRWLRG